MDYLDMRCLVYKAKINTKSVRKGEYKLCFSAYNNDGCRCDNCKKYINTRVSKIYSSNKKNLSKQYSEYYSKNKQHIVDRTKINYYKNQQKRINYSKQYRKNNPEKKKEWRSKNQEKVRQQGIQDANRRRARILSNDFEKYKVSDVLNLYGANCYLCGNAINLKASRKVGQPGWQKGLHIEHVIDIAKGGPDTLANVRPAHALCNLTKKPVEMV